MQKQIEFEFNGELFDILVYFKTTKDSFDHDFGTQLLESVEVADFEIYQADRHIKKSEVSDQFLFLLDRQLERTVNKFY